MPQTLVHRDLLRFQPCSALATPLAAWQPEPLHVQQAFTGNPRFFAALDMFNTSRVGFVQHGAARTLSCAQFFRGIDCVSGEHQRLSGQSCPAPLEDSESRSP